jgi:hypothetical protein
LHRGAGSFSLSEPLGYSCFRNRDPKRSQALPVDPALFLSRHRIDASIDPVAV